MAASFGSNGLYVSRSFGTIWTLEKSAPISFSVSMVNSASVVVVGTSTGAIYFGESTIVNPTTNDGVIVVEQDEKWSERLSYETKKFNLSNNIDNDNDNNNDKYFFCLIGNWNEIIRIISSSYIILSI